jgi:hypothetical protein
MAKAQSTKGSEDIATATPPQYAQTAKDSGNGSNPMNKPIPPLSTAAQAVFDAFAAEARPEPHHQREAIAAAIRALVEQVVPYMAEPDWDASSFNCDIELYTDNQRIRAQQLAIAAELDGGAGAPAGAS